MNFSRQVFVTMDIDWACDGVLMDTLDLIEELSIPVTIFATHPTAVLERMRKNPNIALGIHPNVMPLLQGERSAPQQTFRTMIEELMTLIPEAKCARCHALADATPILSYFYAQGIEKDLNLFIPFSSGIALKPFRHFSGLLRVPFFYEDDAWCLEKNPSSAEEHLSGTDGLKVFNFHPIHLFLNTETMARYAAAKPYYQDYAALKSHINPDERNGARAFLKRLTRFARENGFEFSQVGSL